MYKVVVVEDDQIIRKGICRTIPWQQHGFEVVGEAGDGELAIDIIQQTTPHLVISDINMPFLNGIDLVRHIQPLLPQTRFIFLTGYEDFSYAQQALQLKVFDYLLKPVDKQLLLEKAQQAVADWEKEQHTTQQLTSSQPLLQQQFFKQLLTADEASFDVAHALSTLSIELIGQTHRVLVVRLEEALCAEALEQTVKQWAATYEKAIVWMQATEQEYALLLSDADDTLCKELFDVMQAEAFVTVAYGRNYDNVYELAHSYKEARFALDMRHVLGVGELLSIDDTLELDSTTIEQAEQQFAAAITQGIPEKALQALDDLAAAIIQQKHVAVVDLQVMTIKYATQLLVEIERWQKEQSTTRDFSQFVKDLMQYDQLDQLFGILHDLLLQWQKLLYQKQASDYTSHVDLAIAYMDEHFGDSDLTLQQLARHIHVSTPYLSNLFKLEKGFNFGEYLLKLRMQKAMELLRVDGLKNYEVAEAVGYSNPQYFSICFKKYTGYTPAEYKKKFHV